MAKKNQSVFTFPQTSKTLAPYQPTFWDKAYKKADELKNQRNAQVNTPSTTSANTPSTTSVNTQSTTPVNTQSINDSYNKMVGQYEPDVSKFTGMLPDASKFTEQPGKNGFYGSMSGLEGASMRLANAASQRTMAEAGYGSELKRGETAKEYGLRDISTAKEYGLRDISTAKEYGLKGGLTEKEYGLKESQSAKAYGYRSPFEMQMDMRKKRQEDDKRQKQQYELDRQAQIKARQFLR
jgi:hypothetical protein